MALALPALAVAAPEPPEDCEANVQANPADRESWRCFYVEARRDGSWDAARARLTRESTEHPENGHAWLNRAHIAAAIGTGDGEALYTTALERYTAANDTTGIVEAHIGRAIHHLHQGAPAETVLEELQHARTAADLADDPLLRATADAHTARVLWGTGGDLGRAYALLRAAEKHAFPDGPYQLRLVVLHVLAGICQETGRLDESFEASERLIALTAAAGDRYVEATARLNASLFAFQNPERVPMGTGERESAQALAAAEAVGNPFILAGALCTRAGVLQQTGDDSTELWQRCIDGYEALEEPLMAANGYLGLAGKWASSDPDRAIALAQHATDVARAGGNEPLEVLSRLAVAGFTWDARGPEAGRIAFQAHHEAAERFLHHQGDAASRAGVRSNWADGYYLLADRLAAQGTRGVAEALTEVERLRARDLTDALRRSDLLAAENTELQASLDGLSEQLSRINIALGDAPEPAQQADLSRQREQLEYEERILRERMQRSQHPTGRGLATLPEVQAALGPDEVILAFAVPPKLLQLPALQVEPSVLAVDAQSAVYVALPSRDTLTAAVQTFAGLYQDGANSGPATARAAVAIWNQTVGPALAALDRAQAPTRVALVLDGPLHDLPFAVLRPTADAAPWGTHVALSRVPSITSWLHLRERMDDANGPAMSLGDPAWPNAAGEALPALPAAHWETRAVARELGATVWLGEEAQEARLHSISAPPSLLHIAAHGRDPSAEAGRHALILAEGNGEDGLLEAREVRDLPLRGTVVLLSACRGASGRVLQGDGLDGLSRAFLLAGAPTVVGSLWPLPDADAARFFTLLAPHLADGLPVDHALRAVRAELHAAGVPERQWAGLVAIGDGRRTVKLPHTRPLWPWLLVVGGVVGLVYGRVRTRGLRAG